MSLAKTVQSMLLVLCESPDCRNLCCIGENSPSVMQKYPNSAAVWNHDITSIANEA